MTGQRQSNAVPVDQPIFWEPSRSFLKIAITFTLAGCSIYLLALYIFAPEQSVRAMAVLALMVLAAVGWLLIERGRIVAAVATLSVGFWGYITFTSFFLGGVTGTTIIVYPVIILLLGWLVSVRAAAIVAGLTTAATLAFTLAESWGVLPPPPPTPVAMRWVIQSSVFILTAVLIAYVARSYRSRLDEVRRLDSDLAGRTADLNRAQSVAHVGSWVYDLARDSMQLSAETCRIFGVPEGARSSHAIYLSRVHPEDRGGVAAAWQSALAGDKSFDNEHRILVGENIRWVRQRAELEFGADGRPVRSVGITQDITERKRAESELVESRNLLQTIIDTAPLRVFWKDRDLRYLGCNPAFARDAGKTSPDDVIGKDDYHLKAWAKHAELYRADDRSVMESGVSKLFYEEPQTTPEGREIWLRTSKVPLRSHDNRVMGVLGIYEDITERKQVEARLDMAIEVTQIIFWELDLLNDRLNFDKAMLPTLKLDIEEAPKSLQSWLALVHPDDRDAFTKNVEAALQPGGPPFDFEYRMVNNTGAHQWIHTRGGVAQFNASGQPHFAAGTSMNITARKNDQETIRASEEQSRHLASMLRLMCDNVPDMIWAKDLEKRFVFANKAFCEQLLGASDTREPSGKTDLFFAERERAAHPDNPEWHTFGELCQDSDTLTLAAGIPSVFEEFGNVKGRHLVLDVHKAPFHDADGNVIGTVGSARDITARKSADKALRESENRLSAVFHASPIGISISRMRDGTLLDTNEAALQMYGYRRDEAIGRTVSELGIYAIPAQRDEVVKRLQAHGHLDRFPMDLHCKSGATCMIEVSVRIIELEGEKCLVSMMVDVTERKRLEQVNLQAQKLQSLGTLAGGIAHDFNNILSAIRGNADLAAEDVGPDHIAAESLEEIRKSSARASELVRRILAFGQPREASLEPVQLGGVVDEVLRLLRSTLPAGISLKKEFSRETPDALADTGQVHEAIVNLTTNAAYAIGPRAGTIEYRLEPVRVSDDLARSIPGLAAGSYARLTVSDSGCGMDATMLERIFDAFYTTKPVGEGAGLGLSMVHGIMRSHGGAVSVESTPGKGSHFALYFPATTMKAVKKDERASAQHPPGAGQRVLYVDDEEALVFLATRVLSRLGHTISGYTDPEKALAAFQERPQDFDIVVTDLSMPHMSGFDLARELLAARPDIPILMTTGYIRDEDVPLAREAGIRELVLKPVTINELAGVLDRLFRANSQRKPAPE